MKRTTTPALLLAAALLLGAAACGNDDDSAADTTAPLTPDTTAAAAADTTAPPDSETTAVAAADTTAVAGLPGGAAQAVGVSAKEPSAGEYAFEGVPETLPARAVDLQFTNAGGEPHELALVRVEGDHEVGEFLDKVVNGEGQPIPDWVLGHTGVGTTPPTQRTDATVVLQPGTYLYYCSISDKNDVPHAKNGMAGTLEVQGDASAAQLPATQATVTIRDYAFDVSGLTAGTNSVTVKNTGKEFHHVVLFPYAGEATLADVKKFLSAGPGAPADTSAPAPAPPVVFDKELSSAVLGPGESLVTTMQLTAGRWVALCFVTDKAGGAPHAMAHGMVQDVTVT